MTKDEVLTAVQRHISIIKESGLWEQLSKDTFWPKTHAFIVDTLSQENPDIVQEQNARYMAEQYFNVFGAFHEGAKDASRG